MVARPTRKVVVYTILITWILGINLWLYQNKDTYSYRGAASSIYDTFSHPKESDEQKPKENLLENNVVQLLHEKSGVVDVRGIDSHSTNYDDIFAKHDVNSVLSSLSFQQRCDLYFTNLYEKDINWAVSPHHDFYFENRHSFLFEKFKSDKWEESKNELAGEWKVDKSKVDEGAIIERVRAKYNDFWKKTQESEQGMTDYVSHFRLFNKCYIDGDNTPQIKRTEKFTKYQKEFLEVLSETQPELEIKPFVETEDESLINHNKNNLCTDLEKRVYPWLSFSDPIFERWTGEKFYSPPKMSDFVESKEIFQFTSPKAHRGRGADKPSYKLAESKGCYLTKFKNAMNGKGIVLSIGNLHVDDTVRLIHLLRALNNPYPIQIVYYENLSKDTKQKIVHAARDQISALPKSFNKVHQYFPDDYLNEHDNGLPMQEIWFVNTWNTINDNYRGNFKKFANKFLAAVFNSFEEYILMDADTVPVQTPEFFFKLKGYVQKGAYFYQDRKAQEFRPISDGVIFKKLSPSIIDTTVFDIPIVSNHTLKLDFFAGMFHQMESGLVVIDRNRHFSSVLMMIQLNFFRAVTDRSYGDKELFWLAFMVNGDEGYEFNKFPAGAIGQRTPQKERLKSNGKERVSVEMCSAHPGHLNGEDGKTLAWFNSGFKFCGQSDKVDYEKEFGHHNRFSNIKSAQALKQLFSHPLRITEMVIPPFKNKLETLCDNDEEEPKESWHMDKQYCNSYLWCAYSSIGGKTKDGSNTRQVGRIVQFDQHATDLFAYYGDVWLGLE